MTFLILIRITNLKNWEFQQAKEQAKERMKALKQRNAHAEVYNALYEELKKQQRNIYRQKRQKFKNMNFKNCITYSEIRNCMTPNSHIFHWHKNFQNDK